MAFQIIDTEWLDEILTTMANIIRSKTGYTESITFPEGFITALDAVSGAGIEEYIKNENMDITIPSDITTLRSSVFKGWSNVQSVNIDSYAQLQTIEDNVFNGTQITTFTVPRNVTSISSNAFIGCDKLQTLYLYAKEGEIVGAPWGATNAKIIYDYWDADIGLNSVSQISDILQDDGSVDLNSRIIIDDKKYRITSISDRVFYNNTSITSITISGDITAIGNRAFYGCSNLTNIIFSPESSCKSIGDYCFYGSSVESITIPDTVQNIGTNAFYNIPGIFYNGSAQGSPWGALAINGIATTLTAELAAEMNMIDSNGVLNIPATYLKDNKTYKIVNIADSAFQYDKTITAINMPDSITKMGKFVFWGCTNLTQVTMSDNIESMGINCFYDCTKLNKVNIPSKLTYLTSATFASCPQLKEIYIPPNITSLSNAVFQSSGIQSIVLPEGVTSIGTTCFMSCTSLKTITLPTTLKSLDTRVFKDCTGLEMLTIPEGVTTIGADCFLNVKCVIYNGTATGSPWGALKISSTPLISFTLMLGSPGFYTELTAWAEPNTSWAEWCQNVEYNPLYEYRENATDTIYCSTSNVYYYRNSVADGPITLNGINVKSTDTIVANATYYGTIDTSMYG
jgi:hypothetical protein